MPKRVMYYVDHEGMRSWFSSERSARRFMAGEEIETWGKADPLYVLPEMDKQIEELTRERDDARRQLLDVLMTIRDDEALGHYHRQAIQWARQNLSEQEYPEVATLPK